MKTLFFALGLVFGIGHYTLSAATLPYAALSTPVLITLTNGETASGFYLAWSNHMFLATARHVLFKRDGSLQSTEATLLSAGYAENEPDIEVQIHLGALQAHNEIRAHPTHDVAVVRMASGAGTKFVFHTNEVSFTNHFPGFTTVGGSFVRRLSNVKPGEDVFVFGYPTSIGLRQLPKFDYSKPLLRKGIVSGIYKKTQTIVLDSSVYFGNSGGPVMVVNDKGEFAVIGVVSELIPFLDIWENKRFNYTTANLSNSGYAVVEPVDFLIDLVWD